MKIVYYNPTAGVISHGRHNPTTTNVGAYTDWTLTTALNAVKSRQMIMISVQDDRGKTIEIKDQSTCG